MSIVEHKTAAQILRDPHEPVGRKASALCDIIRTASGSLFPGKKDEYVSSLLISLRNAISKAPELAQCSQQSIGHVLTQCAQNNWVLGGAMQQAHAVPFGKEAVLIPGWRGLVELAMKSGQMAKPPTAHAVYRGEQISARMVDGELLIDHRFDMGNPFRIKGDDSAITHVYVIGVLKNGARQRFIMTREEIEAHKEQYAKAWQKRDSAWQTAWKEQASKTCIAQMIRRGLLPLSVEDKQIVESAARIETHVEEPKESYQFIADDGPEITNDPSESGIEPGDAAE